VMLGIVNIVVTGAGDEEISVLVMGTEDEEEAGDASIVAGLKEFSFNALIP
jgi:hypothetical protein